MIVYHKRLWGLPLLCRFYGSALPRCLPLALMSGALTLVLELTAGEDANSHAPTQSEEDPWWWHPYPFQTFAFIVGFMLVFRSNFGYARYWEARTNLQLMSTRWMDALTQCIAFDACTLPSTLTDEALQKADLFQGKITHLISLLHALALQTLRFDYEAENLQLHTSKSKRPPMDAYKLNGYFEENVGWFSWKNCFQLGSSETTRAKYYQLLPLYVIHGLSKDERMALGLTTKKTASKKTTNGSHMELATPLKTDRVQTVMSWIHRLILRRRREGGLAVEPPVLARVHHLLSEGMSGYDQCRKTAETQFPFPWAQLVVFCLFAFAATAPFVITAFVPEPALAVALDVILVVTSYALNEVARDLEDPFLYDPNDLPLATYQYDFNEKLNIVLNTALPLTPLEQEDNVETVEVEVQVTTFPSDSVATVPIHEQVQTP
eukprot:g7667.t1